MTEIEKPTQLNTTPSVVSQFSALFTVPRVAVTTKDSFVSQMAINLWESQNERSMAETSIVN